MRILKALTILSLSFLFATQPSFRGMDQTSILNGPIPMAYRHFISEAYNIPLAEPKDIDSFETDLQDVYGFKLSDKKVLWENPNRIKKGSRENPIGGQTKGAH